MKLSALLETAGPSTNEQIFKIQPVLNSDPNTQIKAGNCVKHLILDPELKHLLKITV